MTGHNEIPPQRVVKKFKLDSTGDQEIEIPHASILLTVQVEDETPYLYALVYSELQNESIRIQTIYAPNLKSDKNLDQENFIGTYQLKPNPFAFHVFVELEDWNITVNFKSLRDHLQNRCHH